MIEKREECPSCGEVKRWLYDAQICAACGFGDRCREVKSTFIDTDNARLKARIAELEAENTRIRAALAQSELPCVYCSLPREEWARCQHGFPGCDRADDAVGCPELGASLRAEAAEARNAALVKVLEEVEEYLDDQADVIDGDYGIPKPNRAMQLLTEVRTALAGDSP